MGDAMLTIIAIISVCSCVVMSFFLNNLRHINKMLREESEALWAEVLEADSYISDLEFILLDLGMQPPKKQWIHESTQRIKSIGKLP